LDLRGLLLREGRGGDERGGREENGGGRGMEENGGERRHFW